MIPVFYLIRSCIITVRHNIQRYKVSDFFFLNLYYYYSVVILRQITKS